MPDSYRVQVFVDFWNYTLGVRQIDSSFKTDWRSLPKILTREAGNLVDPGALAIYQGMNVYASYNKNSEKSLHRWATNTLDTFAGVNVHFRPRNKKKSYPSCPNCHTEAKICTNCGTDMRGTEEKGIDTRIATDLVSLAWEGAYDVAVLVSSDQDFVPAAEYLQNKGIKVIHGGIANRGHHLKQKCWGALDVAAFKKDFEQC